ncbi:MAG: hypothetical protein ABIT01_10965 [Thermoanaerobaculia bacterium]
MKSKHLVMILAAATWTLSGCNQDRATNAENRPNLETPKVETKTESTQVGSTLESKTETTTDGGAGQRDVKGVREMIIGTVTFYTAGKKIEVITGEKKSHVYVLDAKDTSSTIDAGVTVGSRVRLVEDTGDNKTRQITVRIEPAAP